MVAIRFHTYIRSVYLYDRCVDNKYYQQHCEKNISLSIKVLEKMILGIFFPIILVEFFVSTSVVIYLLQKSRKTLKKAGVWNSIPPSILNCTEMSCAVELLSLSESIGVMFKRS